MFTGKAAPSLTDIEPLLREVSDVYHLGIHLEVPREKIKEFEKDYPRDVARRRTEIIGYWRDNCGNVTWDGLAAAVDKVGDHGNLVKKLREYAEESRRQYGTRVEGMHVHLEFDVWVYIMKDV